MRYRQVVGLGLCVVDHLYLVEELALAGPRTRFRERRVSVGGMVATALAQAAQLGCNTHILSLIGSDAEGRFARRTLRAKAVRTRRLLLSSELPTTVAVVLVDRRNGERHFLVPDRTALERRAPRFDLSPIDRRSLLLVDGHFPLQALRAVKRAREVGATVIADLSRPRRPLLELLPYVDYPIVPFEFAESYAHGDAHRTLWRLRERYGGRPVVTMGRRGGVYLADGRVRRYRARLPRGAKVRDSTGAGDVFHGAFAAGLYRGMRFPEALDLAARAAGLCCTALGGMGRLMTPKDEGAERSGRKSL